MNITLYTLRSIAEALTSSESVLILLILSFIFYRQNKKTTVMQKMIIGENINSPFELTISQIVIGIFAGILASLMLSYLGVIFYEDSAIYLIFLISIFFMFWNPRLICFSYSGAVLGLVSLILEIVSKNYKGTVVNFFGSNINLGNANVLKIDIVALMTLVAVLHFVEGILVIADGNRGAIPVFTNKDNKIIGGFALKRQWALPIALMFILGNTSGLVLGETVPTPAWWPIIKGIIPANILKDSVVALGAFYGVMGYSSVTFTKTKEEKSIFSGLSIVAYSVALFIFAQLASLGVIFKFLVLIFAPVAHEGMLYLQKYLEIKGEPKFISDEDGIMVLEVAPNSPASEMGIASGDVITEVNSSKIINELDILNASKSGSPFIAFKLLRKGKEFIDVSYSRLTSEKKLGIVFVPKTIPGDSLIVKLGEDKFKDVLDKIKNRDKDEK